MAVKQTAGREALAAHREREAAAALAESSIDSEEVNN